MEPRAALYMRVSTGQQAEHDLSIPDQRQQLQWRAKAAFRLSLFPSSRFWRQADIAGKQGSAGQSKMTPSRHVWLRIAAAQKWTLSPISLVAIS